MKWLDDCCVFLKENYEFIDREYLYFLGNKGEKINREMFNKNYKKIKNEIFKIEEKTQEIQRKHEKLNVEAIGSLFYLKVFSMFFLLCRK